MAFFFSFVMLLGYLIGLAIGRDSALIGLGIAFVIAFVMNIFSYYKSDSVALRVSGAMSVSDFLSDPGWRPAALRFDNTVEGLAIAAGIPKPAPYIIQDPSPNAFATGRNPEHSAVAVTSGLLEMMSDQELEGVIAHEMSHIKNYDILIQTITIVLVGVVQMLADILIRSLWFSDSDDRDGRGIMMIVAILVSIISPIIAMGIQLAVSRKREYLADANGALLTRYPPGLANALKKISGDSHELKTASTATAHLFIAQPLKRTRGGGKRKLGGLFDTHPPIDDRIKRLEEMSVGFQEATF